MRCVFVALTLVSWLEKARNWSSGGDKNYPEKNNLIVKVNTNFRGQRLFGVLHCIPGTNRLSVGTLSVRRGGTPPLPAPPFIFDALLHFGWVLERIWKSNYCTIYYLNNCIWENLILISSTHHTRIMRLVLHKEIVSEKCQEEHTEMKIKVLWK